MTNGYTKDEYVQLELDFRILYHVGDKVCVKGRDLQGMMGDLTGSVGIVDWFFEKDGYYAIYFPQIEVRWGHCILNYGQEQLVKVKGKGTPSWKRKRKQWL